VLLKVNRALKKASFSQCSLHAEHQIMVLALMMEYAVIDGWRHDFASYRRHTPRPRGIPTPNPDERHGDQSATISILSARVLNR
jgi:hypothetical protein